MFNLFHILQEKGVAFTENLNDKVSSNHKDEVVSMMNAVPNLSDAFTHYDSHFIHANV